MAISKYNPQEKDVVDVSMRFAEDPLLSQTGLRASNAALEDYFIQGGFRVCDTIIGTYPFPTGNTETDVTFVPNYRNYITPDRRKIGMVVHTIDDGKFWKLLKNPADTFPPGPFDFTTTQNSDWQEIIVPGTLSAITYNNEYLNLYFNNTHQVGMGYITGVTDGGIQIIGYNSGYTVTEIISGSTFINNHLSGLTDVHFTLPLEHGQFLVFSGGTGKWTNSGGTYGSSGSSGSSGS